MFGETAAKLFAVSTKWNWFMYEVCGRAWKGRGSGRVVGGFGGARTTS
jgi:hypothetical protein